MNEQNNSSAKDDMDGSLSPQTPVKLPKSENTRKRNVALMLTSISAFLLFIFTIIVTGVYEPQGEALSAVNVMLLSAFLSFVLSLISVCLNKAAVGGWLIFILSTLLVIAIIWFLASFTFKI